MLTALLVIGSIGYLATSFLAAIFANGIMQGLGMRGAYPDVAAIFIGLCWPLAVPAFLAILVSGLQD